MKRLTDKQQTVAVSLVRVLASYRCENTDPDSNCANVYYRPDEMCGPCRAWDFLGNVKP